MNDKLKGIIIPTVTTFDNDGELCLDMMRVNYEKWNQTGVRGYMCLGSNGEFRSLCDDEAFKVIQAAAKFRGDGKTLIAGVGRESLYQTLKFIDRIAQANLCVDYVSVLTPCYFAELMTDDTLVEYYTAIADRSAYPVLLYSAPGFANSVCLSVEAVKRLADHPNIHGIKDTSSNMMESYMNALAGRDDFEVLAGSLENIMKCLEAGGRGGVVSAADYFPDQCVEYINIFESKGIDSAKEYLEKLKKLSKATGGRESVKGVKCCMNLCGYMGGLPRLPVLPFSKEIEAEMKEALNHAYFK